MRIFLLGFMGVGKSTLGRMASEQLQIKFLDFDTLIEEDQKLTISEIFAEYGEAFFRKLEHDLLRDVIQTEDDFIMGTGGGLPCFHRNLEVMNEHGYSIYLRANPESIVDRLEKSSGSRPLIANKSKEELTSFVLEILETRSKFYQQATEILDVDLTLSKMENTEHLVEIIRRLRSN